MSALLDQFVEEASDLIEAAGSALLVLERNPSDARAINDLFRSIHTLKGTSALFEFPALTKLVHAGEDVLDGVREGALAISGELVDTQLEVLDLLRTWVNALRATGGLPADAAGSSRDLIARLAAANVPAGATASAAAPETAPAAPAQACDWIDAISEADRLAAFRASIGDGLMLLTVEYAPDTECYFRGEDPFLTCRSLPDLLALHIATVGEDPALPDFDPYVCRLRFCALTTAPRAELDHLFRYVSEQVRVAEIPPEFVVVPSGRPEVDDACREFARECAVFLAQGRVAEVRERAELLVPSLDPGTRSASALRWLLTVMEFGIDRPEWLLVLVAAVGGGAVDWQAPKASLAPVPGSEVVDRLVAEQRRILALPVPEADVLAGRISSVGTTLSNIATAHRALAAAGQIQTATAAALEAADPQLLCAAIAACFESGQLAVPAAAAAARGGGDAAAKPDAPETHHTRLLKVDQAKIDRLMALIGELVVAKNALPFLARRAENVHGSRELGREIGQRYSVIDRLAQEMQEAIMEVRLLPVSEVFARFPRLIRDIARKLDKQIELVLEGEETQADKNIIELLGDPLIHIVRNAADHGIETPQIRIAAGKPAHGTIRLRAMQEGDRVVIEVSDDGKGVDTARVIAKALDRGLIDPEQAERMTAAEAANLIFHPGLSTADAVSDLSGRGVGMDVVQTAIRDAGGSVSVTSNPGAGTIVRLALPLSMAVMRVMTIETAGALYGVPIDMIAETVRIDATAIRQIKQSEAFLLRDTIVPLVRLRRLLHLPTTYEEREAVLVLRMPAGLVGVIVDRFDEHMDIILKPLEGILTGLRGFAGTALLGDGRVLMVLDVKELI